MHSHLRRTTLPAILLAGLAALAALGGCGTQTAFVGSGAAGATDRVLVNRDRQGIAIEGYDPVAYFTDGAPVEGRPNLTASYMGATYHFASDAHRDLFQADPAAYAPAFGGYCGYAASINRLSPTDPHYWQIIDGRLILQHNQKALDAWNKDIAGNVVKADDNWPGLLARNGAPVKLLVNTDRDGLAIDGHDPVAYFAEGKPVKGSPEFAAVYNGATYHFKSMANRVTFENDPARYAPAFGGYCGYAASINKVSPIDPTLFQIIDDRLVLQHTPEAYRLFNQDADASLARADKNWPGLIIRHGR